jgi:uncharacterized protein
MRIAVDQITESPKDLRFAEKIEELNQIYKEGQVRDFRFPPYIDVDLVYYRSGQELFFHGSLEGMIEGYCSRCLKSYAFPIKKEFGFVLTPEPLPAKNKELSRDELGLSFYRADEIDLFPLIKEQVLLALPIRPLCKESCRGLCLNCGTNLNEEPCRCASSWDDPRMAVFRNLKLAQ